MKNVFFDTCVYHQPGIDLLFEVIDLDNILFGSEMVGAVRGIDPETGHYFDDTKRYVDAARRSPASSASEVSRGNARRVYPAPGRRARRRGAASVADASPWTPTGCAFDARSRRSRRFAPPAGCGRRPLPRVRPGRPVPVRAGAQVHARATPARTSCSRCATSSASTRNVIVQATCHGADNRAMVDALRSLDGRARGVADVRPDVTDAELRRAARRPACAACASTSSSASSTPSPTTYYHRDRREDRAARLARRRLLRGAPTWPSAGTSSPRSRSPVVVDHMGRPDVTKPVDGPEFGLFLRLMREHDERLVARSAAPSGSRSRAARLRRRACPFARTRRRGVPRPRAVGHRLAAPEPEEPHARRRPARRLHPAHRAHRTSCSSKLLVDNPTRLYWEEAEHGRQLRVRRHPGHDGVHRRAVAPGLPPQPVLHEPDEGAEPRALQGRRARLPRRVADDRGPEAGGARPRLQRA